MGVCELQLLVSDTPNYLPNTVITVRPEKHKFRTRAMPIMLIIVVLMEGQVKYGLL